jgi:DeoR/GlpR family transcriptional regulator of sugar metabolism
MLKRERHKTILNHLEQHGSAVVSVLSDVLKVSSDSIRRDLQELADQRLLTRVHGGALPKVNPVSAAAELATYCCQNSSTTLQRQFYSYLWWRCRNSNVPFHSPVI